MVEKFAFENLIVWQEAIMLNKKIYRLAKSFPKDEAFALASQIKRAVVSINLNIAEGKGRFSKKEFAHFLYLARASLYEVVACLEIALSETLSRPRYTKKSNKIAPY